MSKKCVGCGAVLQTENREKPGYTKSFDMDYCMRCFRLKHYHEKNDVSIMIDPDKIIKTVNEDHGFVFFFLDILNIYEENLAYFRRITQPKILVISKIDVIPKNISLKNIENWLRKHFKILEPILFVQGKKTSAKKIRNLIEENEAKKFYFLGITNAGKSTLLNLLVEEYSLNKKPVLVSEIPNTTLDFIQISLPNQKEIIDSAGFAYSYVFDEMDWLKKAIIKKPIKPRTFYLKEGTNLVMEEQIILHLNSLNSITFYGSENLKLKKNYQKQDLPSLTFKVPASSNIYLKGLGFFYLKNADQVTISGVGKANIAIEPSFLGGRFYDED